jgi:DNA-binding transcriptional LysR family regulator
MDPDYDLFCDIVAAGSLSAAAREQRLSVANVSKRLARLEGRLKARLIHRTTRRLSLTASGHELHAELAPLRAALRAIEDRIAGRNESVAGPLRVTAPTSFGRMYVAPALPAFFERYPQVELDLDLSDALTDLAAAGFDLAIRIGARTEPSLAARRLARSRRVLCAAPAYLARHGEPRTLAELPRHAVLAATGQLPWQLDGPEGTTVIKARSAITTNSSEVVRELAIGGCGIALRSLWDVAHLLATGELVRILPAYEGSHDVAIFAVHPHASRLPAAAGALIDHLDAEFRQGERWERG